MKLNDIYKEFETIKTNSKITTELIGESELGNKIFSFTVGNNKNKIVIVEGGLHAREYITTFLCIELIKFYAEKELDYEICFVPLANPDGVGLCLEGRSFLKNHKKLQNKIIKINKKSKDFSLWKANINGVDLNVNFDALWAYGKTNSFCVGSQNFVGVLPETEKENKVLKKLVIDKKPYMLFCFHSKGQVLYYGFEALSKKQIKRDFLICKAMQKVCGYKPVKTKQSVGGFSDWVSLRFGCPCFTVEVGSDKAQHPIKKESLKEIFNQTKHLILVGVNEYEKLKV